MTFEIPSLPLSNEQDVLAAMIAGANRIVAFTGAGLSTECGIPDFRSPGNPWKRGKPIDFPDFVASEDSRREAWRRKFAIDDLTAHAQPGRGHRALARLVESGKMIAVITQNIDGLHQRSGVSDGQIIELHGNGSYAACLGCGRRHELAPIRRHFESTGESPRCTCGGIVKAATISFGQPMPASAMLKARQVACACDLFLAIGSSLVVRPAAGLPIVAKQNGAKLLIVNGQGTPLDFLADCVLRGDIGTLFEHVDARPA
jgi:NAD-dependent deacetylase